MESALMDYRALVRVARVVLHTIVSERVLIDPTFVEPKQLDDELVFQQCTDQCTAAYIDDVVWTLKGILRLHGQVEARLQIFSHNTLREEWTLEFQVGHMQMSDVQASLDHITAASSYLPVVNEARVFKVSVLLDRGMKMPSKCRVAEPQPILEGEVTRFRSLASLRVSVVTKDKLD